jgi:tRNA1Val (adenine37-N6)-methyltransferase
MSNAFFAFKEFTVKQDKCAMKVGTDAVLLGSWVLPIETEKEILDIGTGTGLLALMMAQRSQANIDAIDIDACAIEQATDNIAASKWADRIKLHHIALQDFKNIATKKYDLIISNPPYFIDSFKANGESRNSARHADSLPYKELLESSMQLLSNTGRLCVILPAKESEILRDLATEMGIKLSVLVRVFTKADADFEKRHILQFQAEPKKFEENKIVIENNVRHDYTYEYKSLTKDFYMHF